MPGSGVYAARAYLDGVRHSAVVNIGTRPTFGGTDSVIEAHLLDFTDNLYERVLKLDFVVRLRSERKFGGIEELVAAIGNDVQSAKHVLEGMQ